MWGALGTTPPRPAVRCRRSRARHQGSGARRGVGVPAPRPRCVGPGLVLAAAACCLGTHLAAHASQRGGRVRRAACRSQVSTRILGRRTASLPPLFIYYRVPHGFTQDRCSVYTSKRDFLKVYNMVPCMSCAPRHWQCCWTEAPHAWSSLSWARSTLPKHDGHRGGQGAVGAGQQCLRLRALQRRLHKDATPRATPAHPPWRRILVRAHHCGKRCG